jgi:hypothetical protein
LNKSDKWQKRAFKKDMDSFYYWNYLRDKPISYFLNPKPINISILFNGALTCLFCRFWKICSGHICWYELDKIDLFDEICSWGFYYLD